MPREFSRGGIPLETVKDSIWREIPISITMVLIIVAILRRTLENLIGQDGLYCILSDVLDSQEIGIVSQKNKIPNYPIKYLTQRVTRFNKFQTSHTSTRAEVTHLNTVQE